MVKKYLVYALLALVIGWYLLGLRHEPAKPGRSERPAAPSVEHRSGNNPAKDFDRSAGRIIYSRHARCRMDCRHINEEEVKEILRNGTVNTGKIETDSRGTTYPVEGITQGHHVRIVFAPKEQAVEVVTCIDLDKDWPCDCK